MSCQVTSRRAWALLGLTAGMIITCTWAQKAAAQDAADPHTAIIQEFQNRVAQYVKLHKSAEAELSNKLKKPTNSTENIQHHEHELREAIVARRTGVGQGNIFTPRIAAEFRRLIGFAYHFDAKQIRESLLSSEPGTANVEVHVNKEYPDKVPLQTMPPTLLLNLPPLPPELEYRIVGHELILRDIGANLIVDRVEGVVPK
jgi:hypothetical protein